MEGLEIVRLDQGGAGEYHAHIPGTTEVGRLSWIAHERADGAMVRAVVHTLVPPEYEGRGIAAKLLLALIDDAKKLGFRIEPQCSYAAAQFRRHPEWNELRA